ncbi:hypothetical protein GGX14DRAFT_405122 [Mycena pura]|uniref:Protein kinase domain-containing protein n=1 Tax=Mycena pura TaxID=153505 RepID=A0AAD6UT67_9AGAR|nr:hypothetical protein GGX14DRAFT_405122 [Mycena pura]
MYEGRVAVCAAQVQVLLQYPSAPDCTSNVSTRGHQRTRDDDSHLSPLNTQTRYRQADPHDVLASVLSSASAQITLRLAVESFAEVFRCLRYQIFAIRDKTYPRCTSASSPLTATPASVPPRASNGDSPLFTPPPRNLRPSRTVPSPLLGTPGRMNNVTPSDSPIVVAMPSQDAESDAALLQASSEPKGMVGILRQKAMRKPSITWSASDSERESLTFFVALALVSPKDYNFYWIICGSHSGAAGRRFQTPLVNTDTLSLIFPMPVESLVTRLSRVEWGRTHEQFPALQHSSTLAEQLGFLSIWEALAAADLFLPPFQCHSTRTSLALESEASQSIPPNLSLRLVSEDLDWMEDLENFARQSWPNTEECTSQNSKWQSVLTNLKAVASLRFWCMLCSTDRNGTVLEHSENETDTRVQVETVYMKLLYDLIRPGLRRIDDKKPLATFHTTFQETRKLNIKYRPEPDSPGLVNLARVEDKTALVQMHHARALQDAIGKHRLLWSGAATGIYTEAYSGAFSDTVDNIPQTRIVVMGNPSLWRMACALDGELVVTKWYSTNPTQARQLLPADAKVQVHQGHLLRQKLALTAKKDLLAFISSRRRNQPSRLDTFIAITVNWMLSTRDAFTRLSETVSRSATIDISLGGPRVHARCIRSSKDFLLHARKSQDFRTVKMGRVWTNGEWYLKIPSGVDEVIATREVSLQVAGVVQFVGELTITTGEHRVKILLATRAAGEPAGYAGDFLEETLSVEQRDNVRLAILAMHEAGWHHHDIHPANVLLSGDTDITIVDFGRAQRASECSDCCMDRDILVELSISPSPSIDTAVEELSQSLTTIREEIEQERDKEDAEEDKEEKVG